MTIKAFSPVNHLLFFVSLFLGVATNAFGQARLESIKNELMVLSADQPGLDNLVDMSVAKMPVQEFFRSLAVANKLNITVDPAINITVTNAFADVSVKDIIIFMAREYDLNVIIDGRILTIGKYEPPKIDPPSKELLISYDSDTKLLSLDLRNDSLVAISRQLTELTNENIIFTPDLVGKLVSVYVRNDTLDEALEKLAISNNLMLVQEDDYYLFFSESAIKQGAPQSSVQIQGTLPPQLSPSYSSFPFKANSMDDITINANNIPIRDIIHAISQSLKTSYFIYSEMKEPATLNLNHVSYEELLTNLLNGSNYTFQIEKGIFLIGERDLEGIRETRVIKMRYRAITDIIKVIPDRLKRDVTIQDFPDLNSLIVSGSAPLIAEIQEFLNQIDAVVPVIYIEVMILDFQTGYTLSTGIEAGLGDKPVQTSGTISPGIDLTLGSSSVNSIINSINGAGLFNLGKVSPNFYVSIKLMEDQGMLKVRSTPKLSTLNGHEAVMKITKTEYYLEETSQIFANASTTQTKTRQFKPVDAEFSITITPIVSDDDQITMQIKVDQSDFTGTKLSPDAPPNQVSRSFNSLIRVKNEEMILLGGLDEGSTQDSGKGIPVLSRIPILKWIFSSRNKSKSDNRLNIFIKPTIIY